MRRQTVFLFVTGLAAMLASLIVYSALRQKDNEVQQARIKTIQILVAARDLAFGARVEAAAMKTVSWPGDEMPPGAISDAHAVLGSIVKSPFVTNEPIVTSKLFIGDKAPGLLPLLIPPEMRAMSVAVDEVADISGFVLPHSRVDVLAAMNQHGGDRAKIILENVEVLAVAQDIEGKDKPQVEKVVTFLVTPEETERLTLASHEGVLRLALRSYGDNRIVSTAGSDAETVMAAYNDHRVARPTLRKANHGAPAEDDVIEVIRNGKKNQRVHFASDDEIPDATAPHLAQAAVVSHSKALNSEQTADAQSRGANADEVPAAPTSNNHPGPSETGPAAEVAQVAGEEATPQIPSALKHAMADESGRKTIDVP